MRPGMSGNTSRLPKITGRNAQPGSDIKTFGLSHILVLQGVPGEAGAPGLVGPRVSVLLAIPGGPLSLLSPRAVLPAPSSSSVALGPGPPPRSLPPCFSSGLYLISLA